MIAAQLRAAAEAAERADATGPVSRDAHYASGILQALSALLRHEADKQTEAEEKNRAADAG